MINEIGFATCEECYKEFDLTDPTSSPARKPLGSNTSASMAFTTQGVAMHDNIPLWLTLSAVIALLCGAPLTVYSVWISPTYKKERAEKLAQHRAKE